MKKKSILLVLLAFIGLSQMNAQVGIGTTTPDASSILDVESTDKGFLPPRLTTAQRDAIASPAEGLTIFNTTNGCLEFYNGSLWVSACDGSLQPGPLTDCGGNFIAPYITASETEIVDVASGVHTWMDRNLGAVTAARASDDCYAYGNLHQWGRGSDGHEDRNSNTTTGPVAAGSEGSDFITNNSTPFDWLTTPDPTRWNGATKGVHDPCPAGYRVPTEAELDAERLSWTSTNADGAFGSPLKLPAAGVRTRGNGSLDVVGSNGLYWSSTVSGTNAMYLDFSSPGAGMFSFPRAYGFSVRCIKD
jgi:uncharacterized protein (TIGR02145 family)